jgi:hypothetical protein
MCSEAKSGRRRLKDKLARLASACVPAPAAACSLVDDGTMFIYGSNGPIALASWRSGTRTIIEDVRLQQ